MAWTILIIAGLFEVAWASLLPATKNFTLALPTAGFVVTLAISVYLLSIATRTIPIGIGYAVWVGIGALGTALVSITWLGQKTNPLQLVALAGLVVAIVAVKLTAEV